MVVCWWLCVLDYSLFSSGFGQTLIAMFAYIWLLAFLDFGEMRLSPFLKMLFVPSLFVCVFPCLIDFFLLKKSFD